MIWSDKIILPYCMLANGIEYEFTAYFVRYHPVFTHASIYYCEHKGRLYLLTPYLKIRKLRHRGQVTCLMRLSCWAGSWAFRKAIKFGPPGICSGTSKS